VCQLNVLALAALPLLCVLMLGFSVRRAEKALRKK
jgi:hypothetical protein